MAFPYSVNIHILFALIDRQDRATVLFDHFPVHHSKREKNVLFYTRFACSFNSTSWEFIINIWRTKWMLCALNDCIYQMNIRQKQKQKHKKRFVWNGENLVLKMTHTLAGAHMVPEYIVKNSYTDFLHANIYKSFNKLVYEMKWNAKKSPTGTRGMCQGMKAMR